MGRPPKADRPCEGKKPDGSPCSKTATATAHFCGEHSKAHKPVRCGANRRKGRGKCRQWALVGATRCRLHGGEQQLGTKPPGQKPKTGLYSRHFPPAQRELFSQVKIDSLDAEIQAAKAWLDWAYEQWERDPLGGVVQSRRLVRDPADPAVPREIVKELPWVDVVSAHLEKVRRLVESRWKYGGADDPAKQSLDTHKVWLEKQKKRQKTMSKGDTA